MRQMILFPSKFTSRTYRKNRDEMEINCRVHIFLPTICLSESPDSDAASHIRNSLKAMSPAMRVH